MTILEAIILGIIQGVFMFLPVSSTSHLVIVQHWLISRGSALPPPESAEMILFDLVVHVGTLISIAVVFNKSLSGFLTKLKEDLQKYQVKSDRGREFLYLRLGALGLFSVFITGIVGLPLKTYFEQVFAHPAAISATLTVTGILLYVTDILGPRKRGLRGITPGVAAVIGAAQGMALMPGLSRSGMTITFALLSGLKRRWAAEYSFFIAFPTILLATAVQVLQVWYLQEPLNTGILQLATGFIVSALVGIAALKLVLKLLYRARFRYFSYYVWLLAAAVFVSTMRGAL